MRTLWSLLVVALVAGSGGCGGATAEKAAGSGTEQFTQGGVSMEPAVKAGQVITARTVGRAYPPKRGDVVLFHGAEAHWVDTTAPLLKRVIAVGGETVACCDVAGKVTVNGAPLDEPYVADDAPLDVPPNPKSCESRRFGPVTVPGDAVFVMGDNRARSNDSRCAGPIPATSVFAVMITS
ncbi:signal peptidase I [Dactylosporangium sp. NPDC049525]|uniref:signal peptidase I n=1 Tax=Dactylosporangium sp. NPDC049525 TaxID=3154730 RepID=UPI003441C65D